MAVSPSGESSEEITQLLLDWRNGDVQAFNRLWPLVYDQLRRIARGIAFQHGDGNRTLQPTALVHEAYLRLVDEQKVSWQGRLHFYAIAAREVRRILIDEYRRRDAEKRGGEMERVPLSGVNLATQAEQVDFLALNQALDELATLDERQARIVEMHYFGGMTNDEIGQVLGISIKTVERDISHAKGWLRLKLK